MPTPTARPVHDRGRGRRPAPPSQHPADLRHRRGRRLPLCRARAARRRQPGRSAARERRCRRGRRPSWWSPLVLAMDAAASGRHRPSRPQAGQRPVQRPTASPRSPTSAWPSGWRSTRARPRPARSWARPATWPPSRPAARPRWSARPPTSTPWARSSTRCSPAGRRSRASRPMDTVQQVIERRPGAARRGCSPRIPRDLETICLKCLQKEPAKRYATRRRTGRRPEPLPGRRADPGAADTPRGARRQVARRRPTTATLATLATLAALTLLATGIWYRDQQVRQARLEQRLENQLRDETGDDLVRIQARRWIGRSGPRPGRSRSDGSTGSTSKAARARRPAAAHGPAARPGQGGPRRPGAAGAREGPVPAVPRPSQAGPAAGYRLHRARAARGPGSDPPGHRAGPARDRDGQHDQPRPRAAERRAGRARTSSRQAAEAALSVFVARPTARTGPSATCPPRSARPNRPRSGRAPSSSC